MKCIIIELSLNYNDIKLYEKYELTFNRSAVFKKAGSCSWLMLTSPAYMNSSIDCKWLNGTSLSIIIGCFDGFS